MILLTVFIGIYLILGVGYFKLMKAAVPELIKEHPLSVGLVATVWPLAVVYTFGRAAVG